MNPCTWEWKWESLPFPIQGIRLVLDGVDAQVVEVRSKNRLKLKWKIRRLDGFGPISKLSGPARDLPHGMSCVTWAIRQLFPELVK